MIHPATGLAALTLIAALGGPASAAVAPVPATVEAQLRDAALSDPTAYSIVESLTTEIGGRMAGSPAAERAEDWGLAKLKALGFQNVHAEPFAITAWARGPESAEVTAPYPRKLMILGLGGSAPTPPEGIEGEIVLFHSYTDLLAQPPSSLAGKIAVVSQPMPRTQDGSGYGALSRARFHGPAEAAKRGAVAFLIRSISTSDSRLPHTGQTDYEEGVPKIPAAALGVPDGELLERLVARGGPVRVRLTLASSTTENAPAWNVVGEIPGSDKPDEVVVIGGHLDSWDPGEGAIDDGAGVAITTGAAALIGKLPRHPRRTIRVVMFGDEEMDFSGKAYAEAHKAEAGKIVVVSESDGGADPIWSLQLPAGSADAPALTPIASVLAPLKIFLSSDPARFSGSDFAGLNVAGVPAFSFRQDMSRYFDIHHSADDTLNKIDPAKLNQNVAAWAALLYAIAESDIDFRALASPAQSRAERP
jgi:Zn-dependent M28 family amino/carboxypeptidase